MCQEDGTSQTHVRQDPAAGGIPAKSVGAVDPCGCPPTCDRQLSCRHRAGLGFGRFAPCRYPSDSLPGAVHHHRYSVVGTRMP